MLRIAQAREALFDLIVINMWDCFKSESEMFVSWVLRPK